MLGVLLKRYPGITGVGFRPRPDPVGTDTYNKKLSGRRALAIYGMLIRDVDTWEKLYSSPYQGDNWGDRGLSRFWTLCLRTRRRRWPEKRKSERQPQAVSIRQRPDCPRPSQCRDTKETIRRLWAGYADPESSCRNPIS